MTYAVTLPPPDVEAHVYGVLSDLGGIKVWAYDSGPLVHAIFERTALQVDVRASSKKAARDRAYAARSRLLALGDVEWQDGRIGRVEVLSGPLWVPDDDGAPRYVTRVAVEYSRNTWDD